jgi:lipopolysaccharide export system permease protein
MKLVQKYFLRQAFIPLILSLGALSVLALLTQSLSTLDLIVENQQSAFTFLYITVLALPQLFSIILPLAVFMAMLYTLNRLNVDSELVVTKASGFSPLQIASPAIRLASYMLVVHLLINLIIQPLSFREMRKSLLDVKTDVASRLIRAGEFSQPTPGFTIFAGETLPSGRLRDVFIFDERSLDTPVTYSATEGRVHSFDGRTNFTLIDGSVHFVDKNGLMDLTDFQSNTYDLTDIITVDAVLRLKSSDRFLHELINPDPSTYTQPKIKRKYLAEAHSRLATPLYNIALTLLALAFLVRGEHNKLGYGRKIATAAALGFFIRLVGFTLASSAEENVMLNYAQYLLPIVVSLISFWFLLRKRPQKNKKRTIFNVKNQDSLRGRA